MQVISLFSGIGGFELAAEKVGWHNIVSCEINDFGNKILEYYWPDAYHHRDIHTLDFQTIKDKSNYDETETTIIVGGFPCQPYSSAGKRKGKEDERHLWPEMLRIIQDVSPDWVVGENVRGIVNWSDGMVFDEVQADLEAAGYEVTAYILPACAVNAPHRRDRVWFVAKYTKCKPNGRNRPEKSERNRMDLERNKLVQSRRKQSADNSKPPSKNAAKPGGERCNNRGNNREERHFQDNINRDAQEGESERGGRLSRSSKVGQAGDDSNTKDKRLERERISRVPKKKRKGRKERSWKLGNSEHKWEKFPTQSPICGRNDGISERLDGITFPKWRNESIKAFGNAVVPQVVQQIFIAINEYENGI